MFPTMKHYISTDTDGNIHVQNAIMGMMGVAPGGGLMTPYIRFGNDTLAKLPKVKAGDYVLCKCGHVHLLQDSKPPMLLFYRCGDKDFLAAINGCQAETLEHMMGDGQ